MNSIGLVGGGIERWQDHAFRACFADILGGEWRKHDPYDLVARVNAKESLKERENLVSVHEADQVRPKSSYFNLAVYCPKSISRLASFEVCLDFFSKRILIFEWR